MIVKMINRFGMTDLHPKKIPADPSENLQRSKGPRNQGEYSQCNFPYREAVGALPYLALSTRPDIAHTVAQVAKYCDNPNTTHWNAVLDIFAFLRTTPDYGIWLGGDRTNIITGYSGNIFFLYGGPVFWSNEKKK